MKKGFTLIELLVVISIIALLMSVLVPALRSAKERARALICGTHLKAIGVGVFTYANHHSGFIPGCYYDSVKRNLMFDPAEASFLAYRIDKDAPYGEHITWGPWNLGYLFDSQIIEDGEIFYCPSAPRGSTAASSINMRYEGYHDAGHPWPWNSQDEAIYHNTSNVRTGYHYFPQKAQEKDRFGFPEIAKKDIQLGPSRVLAIDLLLTRNQIPHTRGKIGGARGVNALFSDGSVNFCNDREAFTDELWSPGPARSTLQGMTNFRSILLAVE